jgi:hypothetical protein
MIIYEEIPIHRWFIYKAKQGHHIGIVVVVKSHIDELLSARIWQGER